MRIPSIATLLALSLLSCKSADEAVAGSTSTSSAEPQPSSSSASSSSAAAAVPSAMAAVRAGKLTHPGTKVELTLVETSLAKCFGFKGYSMMLPEGSTTETMAGARACAVFLPKAYKKFGLRVMTDEIKVPMWQRTDVEKVQRKILDEPDAFLFEIHDAGKTKLLGWTDGKVGPRRVQCNSMRDDGTMSVDEELAFIELCRTLKYAESAKQ